MSDYISKYPGLSIDEGINRIWTVNPEIFGWLKIKSTILEPTDLDDLINIGVGNYSIVQYENTTGISTISPLKIESFYLNGVYHQLLIHGADKLIRHYDTVFSPWRVLDDTSDIRKGSTEPTDPITGTIWIDTTDKSHPVMKRYDATDNWVPVIDNSVLMASVYDTGKKEEDIFHYVDKIITNIAGVLNPSTANMKTSNVGISQSAFSITLSTSNIYALTHDTVLLGGNAQGLVKYDRVTLAYIETIVLPEGTWHNTFAINDTVFINNDTEIFYLVDGVWNKVDVINGGPIRFIKKIHHSLIAFISNRIFVLSNNGIWSTNITNIPLAYNIGDISYYNGKYYLIGYSDINDNAPIVYVSDNALEWSSRPLSADKRWDRIVVSPHGMFIIASSGISTDALYSVDGITWIQSNILIGGNNVISTNGLLTYLQNTNQFSYFYDNDVSKLTTMPFPLRDPQEDTIIGTDTSLLFFEKRNDQYYLVETEVNNIFYDLPIHSADTIRHYSEEDKLTFNSKLSTEELNELISQFQDDVNVILADYRGQSKIDETTNTLLQLQIDGPRHYSDVNVHVNQLKHEQWSSKAAGDHTHIKDGRVEVDASMFPYVGNKFDIALIPAEVFSKSITVPSDAARFALTTTDVKVGDVVHVYNESVDPILNKWFRVMDVSNLDNEDGYLQFDHFDVISVIFDSILNKPTTVEGYGISDAYTEDNLTTDIEKLESYIGNYEVSEDQKANISKSDTLSKVSVMDEYALIREFNASFTDKRYITDPRSFSNNGLVFEKVSILRTGRAVGLTLGDNRLYYSDDYVNWSYVDSEIEDGDKIISFESGAYSTNGEDVVVLLCEEYLTKNVFIIIVTFNASPYSSKKNDYYGRGMNMYRYKRYLSTDASGNIKNATFYKNTIDDSMLDCAYFGLYIYNGVDDPSIRICINVTFNETNYHCRSSSIIYIYRSKQSDSSNITLYAGTGDSLLYYDIILSYVESSAYRFIRLLKHKTNGQYYFYRDSTNITVTSGISGVKRINFNTMKIVSGVSGTSTYSRDVYTLSGDTLYYTYISSTSSIEHRLDNSVGLGYSALGTSTVPEPSPVGNMSEANFVYWIENNTLYYIDTYTFTTKDIISADDVKSIDLNLTYLPSVSDFRILKMDEYNLLLLDSNGIIHNLKDYRSPSELISYVNDTSYFNQAGVVTKTINIDDTYIGFADSGKILYADNAIMYNWKLYYAPAFENVVIYDSIQIGYYVYICGKDTLTQKGFCAYVYYSYINLVDREFSWQTIDLPEGTNDIISSNEITLSNASKQLLLYTSNGIEIVIPLASSSGNAPNIVDIITREISADMNDNTISSSLAYDLYLYVVGHDEITGNNYIFKRERSATSWTNLSSNLPSYGKVNLIEKNDTNIVITGENILAHTTLSGDTTSWTAITTPYTNYKIYSIDVIENTFYCIGYDIINGAIFIAKSDTTLVSWTFKSLSTNTIIPSATAVGATAQYKDIVNLTTCVASSSDNIILILMGYSNWSLSLGDIANMKPSAFIKFIDVTTLSDIVSISDYDSFTAENGTKNNYGIGAFGKYNDVYITSNCSYDPTNSFSSAAYMISNDFNTCSKLIPYVNGDIGLIELGDGPVLYYMTNRGLYVTKPNEMYVFHYIETTTEDDESISFGVYISNISSSNKRAITYNSVKVGDVYYTKFCVIDIVNQNITKEGILEADITSEIINIIAEYSIASIIFTKTSRYYWNSSNAFINSPFIGLIENEILTGIDGVYGHWYYCTTIYENTMRLYRINRISHTITYEVFRCIVPENVVYRILRVGNIEQNTASILVLYPDSDIEEYKYYSDMEIMIYNTTTEYDNSSIIAHFPSKGSVPLYGETLETDTFRIYFASHMSKDINGATRTFPTYVDILPNGEVALDMVDSLQVDTKYQIDRVTSYINKLYSIF